MWLVLADGMRGEGEGEGVCGWQGLHERLHRRRRLERDGANG